MMITKLPLLYVKFRALKHAKTITSSRHTYSVVYGTFTINLTVYREWQMRNFYYPPNLIGIQLHGWTDIP